MMEKCRGCGQTVLNCLPDRCARAHLKSQHLRGGVTRARSLRLAWATGDQGLCYGLFVFEGTEIRLSKLNCKQIEVSF